MKKYLKYQILCYNYSVSGGDKMAKKKKREVKSDNGIRIELTGILLILLSIIGIARLGIVGKFVQAFATFLVGEIYGILLLILIGIGFYLIIKRKQPNYFSTKC